MATKLFLRNTANTLIGNFYDAVTTAGSGSTTGGIPCTITSNGEDLGGIYVYGSYGRRLCRFGQPRYGAVGFDEAVGIHCLRGGRPIGRGDG